MIDYYPGAEQMPADPTNYRRAGRASFDRIVIHCTDGHADPHGTADMFRQEGHKASAHLVVGLDATVVQCVRFSDVAWHAHAMNGRSVAIEHCARSPGELGASDPGMPPSPVQLAASARAIVWLCQMAGIPIDDVHIVGHKACDPATDHDDCPEGSGVHVALLIALAQGFASSQSG